jgi:secreted PhoX family phosphatase
MKTAWLKFVVTLLMLGSFVPAGAQQTPHISEFPSQGFLKANDSLQLPSTHTFQLLVKAGDPLTQGGTKGAVSDFTGYVPINGSSRRGHLCINSEFLDVDSLLPDFLADQVGQFFLPENESDRGVGGGGVDIMTIHYDSTQKLWQVDSSRKTDFGSLRPLHTGVNCSGMVTPWETMVSCEELNMNTLADDLPQVALDALGGRDQNGDGHWDIGWCFEVDPERSKVVDYDNDGQEDKIWGLGNMAHENISKPVGDSVVYYGEDNSSGEQTSYIYKFVMDQPQDFGAGDLYVLALDTANIAPGQAWKGHWVQVPNKTPQERHQVIEWVTDSVPKAWNVPRVEDTEFNFRDSMVYFASTQQDRIWRYKDHGDSVSAINVYVENKDYQAQTPAGGTEDVFFSSPDNLAFDDKGNLYILQDGGESHVWMIGKDHTLADPDFNVFASFPFESESTGITFSPDYRFMFISAQHPSQTNQAVQQDATGEMVRLNTDATVVISRKEHLADGATDRESYTEQLQPESFEVLKKYPNPATRVLHMDVNSQKQQAIKVTINNSVGYSIRSKTVRVKPGKNTIDLNVQNLAKQLYFITLRSEDGVVSERMMKIDGGAQ